MTIEHALPTSQKNHHSPWRAFRRRLDAIRGALTMIDKFKMKN